VLEKLHDHVTAFLLCFSLIALQLQNPSPAALARLVSNGTDRLHESEKNAPKFKVPAITVPEALLARLPHRPVAIYPALPNSARVLAASLAAAPPNQGRYYAYSTVLELAADVDEAHFHATWAALVRRHEALRIVFVGLPATADHAHIPFAACVMPPEAVDPWMRIEAEEEEDIETVVARHHEGVHARLNPEGVMMEAAFIIAGSKRKFMLTTHHALIGECAT
jgi:hypothetical protein